MEASPFSFRALRAIAGGALRRAQNTHRGPHPRAASIGCLAWVSALRSPRDTGSFACHPRFAGRSCGCSPEAARCGKAMRCETRVSWRSAGGVARRQPLAEAVSLCRQKRRFLRGAGSTEHGVSMRKAAEAGDDVAVACPAFNAPLHIGAPRRSGALPQRPQESETAVLFRHVLGVVERMVEPDRRDRMQLPVESSDRLHG